MVPTAGSEFWGWEESCTLNSHNTLPEMPQDYHPHLSALLGTGAPRSLCTWPKPFRPNRKTQYGGKALRFKGKEDTSEGVGAGHCGQVFEDQGGVQGDARERGEGWIPQSPPLVI